ncbi:hypothetical protein, partial [Pectobacterium parmentieri]|uniref:hypothetical protein n=1 Tax=Pectobacterium parmentieri TaxID=1905730 RepID=UPI001E2A180C
GCCANWLGHAVFAAPQPWRPWLRGMSLTTSAKHADRLPVPQCRRDEKYELESFPIFEMPFLWKWLSWYKRVLNDFLHHPWREK